MKNLVFHTDSALPFLPAILRLLTGVFFLPVPFFAQLSSPLSFSRFHLTGAITFKLSGYSASGIDDRYEPLTWLISGSPVVTAGKIRIPLRIQTGNLGTNRFGQPFQKFSIHPKGKWWSLHFGHTNLNWSPFTLSGRTLLGGAIEINKGKFRLGIAYGQLQNAVEDFTDTFYQKPPVILFKRKGFAARLGIGTSQDHWDLIFFKARDDTASLTTSVFPRYTTPQENLVLGLHGKQRISEHLRLDMDLALSAYSNNLGSEASDLEENALSNALKSIFTPRFSSRYNAAGEGSLKYQQKEFGIDLRYKRIDADFKSMGAYFLQHDLENFLIGLNFQAFQNRLTCTGSYGLQKNNVSNLRSSDTSRKIGRWNLQYSITPRVQLYAQYHNFITELQRNRDLLVDTLALNQKTRHFSIGGRWTSSSRVTVHSILVEGFFRNLDDEITNASPLYQSKGIRALYKLQYVKSQSSLETGVYLDRYDFTNLNYLRLQPHLAIHPVALRKKLFLGVRMTISMTYAVSELQTVLCMPGITAVLRASRKHQLNFYLNYLGQSVKTPTTGPDYSELRSELSYSFHFH